MLRKRHYDNHWELGHSRVVVDVRERPCNCLIVYRRGPAIIDRIEHLTEVARRRKRVSDGKSEKQRTR